MISRFKPISAAWVAGELGALLDKGFFSQELPKLPPNVKTASESLTEAI